MIEKIIKWNLAFTLLYALSSTLIYFISQDTPETIPVIILTCLIFNGLITIYILHTHLKKSRSFTKIQDGGEEDYGEENTDETIADIEPAGNDSSADNIY